MLNHKSLAFLTLFCGLSFPVQSSSTELLDVLGEGEANTAAPAGPALTGAAVEEASPPTSAGTEDRLEEVIEVGLEEDQPLLPVSRNLRAQDYGCCAMMRSPECCSCLVGHGIIAALFGLTYLICSFVS